MKGFIKYNPNKNRNLRFQIVASFVLALFIFSFRSSWDVAKVANTDMEVVCGEMDLNDATILPPLPLPKQKEKTVNMDRDFITEISDENVKLVSKQTEVSGDEEVTLPDNLFFGIGKEINKEERLTMPDRQASYPGGESAAISFLTNMLEYPEKAIEDFVECVVKIKVFIDEHGNMYHYEVVEISRLGYGFDKMAIETIKKMPKWEPAVKNNSYVKSAFVFPIIFEIQ